MISGLSGITYEEKCQEIGLETLEERRRQQDLLQAYKICTGSGKDMVRTEILFNRIGAVPDTRNTRFLSDPLNIMVNRTRLDIRKHSYADWNNLSIKTKSSGSVAIFKNAIKPMHYPGRQVAGPRRIQATPDN